jgi:hypothetical protein
MSTYTYRLQSYSYDYGRAEEANERVRLYEPPEANEHGLTSYRRGCRCEVCRRAKRADAMKYRQKLKISRPG